MHLLSPRRYAKRKTISIRLASEITGLSESTIKRLDKDPGNTNYPGRNSTAGSQSVNQGNRKMNIPEKAIPPMEWNGINNNINNNTSTKPHSIPYHSTPLKQQVDRFIKDVRNRGDRATSISELSEELGCSWKAAEYKYYADRKNLLKYFSARPR